MDQPVLPAVVAMEALFRVARDQHSHLRAGCLKNARFEKFLYMDRALDRLEAIAELETLENGDLQAALLTRTRSPKAAFTRTKIHARLSIEQSMPTGNHWPLDVVAGLEGINSIVTPDSIYEELVPFGASFRNIKAPLCISPDGALARIETPGPAYHEPEGATLLGSPYALDAAFHAACVWAQHFRGIVAFPVALERRAVSIPTLPSNTYIARIMPGKALDDLLNFDIVLLDQNGRVCETAEGVHMRDVSGGRLQPPAWIRHNGPPDPLHSLRQACAAMTVVELDTPACFAPQTLTPLERGKYHGMGVRRRKSYLAARLALKRLWRRTHGEDRVAPAGRIETVHKDSPLPRIGRVDSEADYCCSVSHNRRFAVAAADTRPLGVDVEVISPKALQAAGLFTDAGERELIQQAPSGGEAAAVRIWSIKEAAAKAMGINLAEAWARVRVTSIGGSHSGFSVDGRTKQALHAQVDDHLFTLIPAEEFIEMIPFKRVPA